LRKRLLTDRSLFGILLSSDDWGLRGGIIMATHFSFDRESFQVLLASAFAIQESSTGTKSLSALLDTERSIDAHELDFDQLLQAVADRTRNVATASGIAIALLRGDQLVYRAANGSASSYIGRQMTAVLNVSTRKGSRTEILRVENAQSETRVEAAVCRQLGATSLLILPICRGSRLVGVLEVLFSEVHRFQDMEVRAYRLIAQVIEQALSYYATHNQECPKEIPAKPLESAPGQTGNAYLDQARSGAAAAGTVGGLAKCLPFKKSATPTRQLVKRASADKLVWSLATAAAIISLITFDLVARHHSPVQSVEVSRTQASSNAADRSALVLKAPQSLLSPKPRLTVLQSHTAEAAGSRFMRLRVSDDEVDDVSEDVTVRHFTPALAPAQSRVKEVDIGDDVTIRQYVYQPMIVPDTSVGSSAVHAHTE
jgi:GAF domain-containing protein